MSVSLCRHMRVTAEAGRELESQMVVQHQTCVLGIIFQEQHGNVTTISPAPHACLLIFTLLCFGGCHLVCLPGVCYKHPSSQTILVLLIFMPACFPSTSYSVPLLLSPVPSLPTLSLLLSLHDAIGHMSASGILMPR